MDKVPMGSIRNYLTHRTTSLQFCVAIPSKWPRTPNGWTPQERGNLRCVS